MDDEQISDFAAQLETTIHSEEVFVKIVQHGGGPDESHIRANRAGYLHLASLFLRAAIAPYKVNDYPDIVDIDANSFIDEDSDISFTRLERSESIERPQGYKLSFLNKLISIGWVAFAILLFAMLIIGISTAIRWFF
jgi:hypothetical protein